MKVKRNVLYLAILIFICHSCKVKRMAEDIRTPPEITKAPEKVKLHCNEPFYTIEVREDLNQIIVTYPGVNTTPEVYPFTPYTINNNPSSPYYLYKERSFGGWYQGTQYRNYYLGYKTAVPNNSCQDDMSGQYFQLVGKIVPPGRMNASNACGENL